MSKKLSDHADFYLAMVEEKDYFSEYFQVDKFPMIVLVDKEAYYEYEHPRFTENMREYITDKLYYDSLMHDIPG